MMLRSLAIAALTLAGSGIACAQSVYLYVAPGASVYVTSTPPNGAYYNGAPAAYPELYPGPYAPPAPVVAAPGYGPVVAPPYLAPAPAYGPTTYGAPLQAYGAAPGLVMQRRVYVGEAPRPPAALPYGRTRR
jgi:hypothetical protein